MKICTCVCESIHKQNVCVYMYICIYKCTCTLGMINTCLYMYMHVQCSVACIVLLDIIKLMIHHIHVITDEYVYM